MSRVRPGSIAKNARLKAAAERLEQHLSNHQRAHPDYTKEQFDSHDKVQRVEMKHLHTLLA